MQRNIPQGEAVIMQNLLSQTLMFPLAAGLLGLAIGWIWWGMRVRQARERATELERKVSKLNGYPARLTDLEATHAAYVASKNEEGAKTKAKIADLDARIAEHEAAHRDKDARLATLLSRLRGTEAAVKTVTATAAVPHFYDVNEGKGGPEASEAEKRVTELAKEVAAKEEEIAGLKAKIAEFETAPDLDSKRHILLTARTAELASLKGILNTLLQPLPQDEVARRAYGYAQDRGFHGGSPTEDWYRAERDVHYGRLAYAWENTRGGTLY